MRARARAPAGNIVERFDRAATRYESWYQTSRGARAARIERRLLTFLLSRHSKKGLVLEVGCGTGYFTEWLDRGWGRAIGLDPAKEMLRELRRRGRRFPVVQGDAHDLPFASGSFESVAFITTIEFLDDPEAALREAVRVARREIALLWLNPWSVGALRRKLAPSRLLSLARPLTVREVRGMLFRAAGDRARGIEWASALFPWPLSGIRARIPLGDVLAVKLCLAPPRSQNRREVE